MKMYLKASMILAISFGIGFLLMSTGCDDAKPAQSTSSTSTTSSSTSTSTGGGGLQCEVFPSCSGSDCCDKDDDTCDDHCTKDGISSGLALSSTPKKKCLTLEKDLVKDLVRLRGVFHDAETGKLEDLEADDFEKMCSAFVTLTPDLLENLIDSYSTDEASNILALISRKENVIDLFIKTDETEGERKNSERPVDLFRALLHKSGGSEDDAGILAALKKYNDGFSSKDKTILHVTGEDKLVEFIHNNIIYRHENSLCGESSESNYPKPASGTAETEVSRRACLLGVYCYIFPHGQADNDDKRRRNDFAGSELNGVSGVGTFIRKPSPGGIGLSESDSEDWNDKVCEELEKLWNNGGDLDLGLGGSSS